MRFAKTMKQRLNSLGFKLLLAYLAGMALSMLLLFAAVGVVWHSGLLARLDLAELAEEMSKRIRFDAAGLPAGLQREEDDDDDEEDGLAWVFDALQHETAYRVLDSGGQAMLLSPAGPQFWSAAANVRPQQQGLFDFVDANGITMHVATERLERQGRVWYVQTAASTRLMELMHRVALPLVAMGMLAFGLVLLAAFGLCAFVTLRYTLRPLRVVSESAAAISPRSLHARLATGSVPMEIGPLVESFNRVLERVEQGYRVQQEFLANAAHELKTPLALIRAQIELEPGEGGSRDALLSDVAYMSRQVQQLLLLAEASEAHNYQFGETRVGDVAQEAVVYLQRRAEGAGVHLAVSAADADVRWTADHGALFTLLKNLLENAIEHAPAGSTVDVEITGRSIAVRDQGPGVDAEQLPLLFERFWRGPHRRDLGAGLGLAICQEIALAHGWSLTAEPATPGLRLCLALGQTGA